MKTYKTIGLLISAVLLSFIFFNNSQAQVLTKQITGYMPTSSVRAVNGDSVLGSKEIWTYTGSWRDQTTRKTDDRTGGTVVSPTGWVYKGGTTTVTDLPKTVEYTDADGYKGTLYLDKDAAPYFGWDRYKIMGYDGLNSNGTTKEYIFTKDYPVPGRTNEYYNGCTLEDIGVYSGTVSKTVSKPVASITAPISVVGGTNVNVIGSGTDPTGLSITEYTWTSSNGQTLTGTGGNITVNAPVTLTLKVKNSEGVWSDTVSHVINVQGVPNKPIAKIDAPTSTHIGTTVAVKGSGTDPSGLAITEYTWTSSNGETLTGTGGNIKADYPVTLTLKVKNSANIWSDITTHLINTENEVPSAKIVIPPLVYAGDDIFVSGYGEDKDGDILEYYWDTPSDMYGKLEGQGGIVYFTNLGIKYFGLTVVDPSGDMADAVAQTNVIAPTPYVNIVQTGTLKENRKVIIDTSTSTGGSKRATITSKKYVITALNGTSMNDVRIQSHTVGSTNGTILYDPSKGINSSLDGLSSFDMTFKKPGQYKIDCTITNIFGKTSTNTMTLTIVLDAPPKAGFYTPEKYYRTYFDPNKFNGLAYAILPFTDTETGTTGCYSTDGDTIDKRAWFFSFDFNNNDVVDDIWYPYNAATNKWDYSIKYTYNQAKNFNLDSFQVGNLKAVTLESAHAGVHYSGIICKEAFGQEYIPQFVTDADRKVGNGFDE